MSGLWRSHSSETLRAWRKSKTVSASITKGRRAAFTLAEVLITLAIIGIVAVVTIPTLVKNHNEHAWSTAKDVFSKRLDVAMKTMNTDGTLTGYATTAEFVKALKKNIKINQVCTDDVTKCFAKILGPQNGGYTYLTNADCTQAKTDGKIDVDYCFGNTDYYAGAVLACGGKKANLPSPQQLALLGTELYNYNVGTDDWIAKRPPSNGY